MKKVNTTNWETLIEAIILWAVALFFIINIWS